ncbi:ArsR/SmtB family transcription factor [Pseudonocardia sp. GCM10023141]|uniref:ArsR/SmtB family transcription factor n=1 Tax=Pseudonocardia sp. GCM10023141 TaxID=3252653 RepID=UPI003611F7A2
MSAATALADLASLLADRTRARFCLALLDGRAWTAGELADLAGVRPPTASEHLGKLVAGGLLAEERQGRHRYVRLASAEVAHLVEALAAHAAPQAERPVGLRAVHASAALAGGRTCYDHLAGRLGVGITDALVDRRLLVRDGGFALSAAGLAWMRSELGFEPARSRRPVARDCLDWTERRTHLGGQAGAHIRTVLQERGWTRRRGDGRAVRLTEAGAAGLRSLLDLEMFEDDAVVRSR